MTKKIIKCTIKVPYLIGWRLQIKTIRGSAFADRDKEVLDFFSQFGFNIHKDIKRERLKKPVLDQISDTNTDSIRDLQNTGDLRSAIICSNEECTICVVKIRVIDPRNNRGKSSGFRIYSLLGVDDEKAIIFHLYPKTGSNREDNISDSEKNNILQLIQEIDMREA